MDLNSLLAFFMDYGLLGVLCFFSVFAVWYMYKSNTRLLEEKGNIMQTMSDKRVEDVEIRMAELRSIYEADKKHLELRIEKMERNTELMIESFDKTVDQFQKSTQHYEKAIERMERTEQKIDKVSWELEAVHKKLDKMGD